MSTKETMTLKEARRVMAKLCDYSFNKAYKANVAWKVIKDELTRLASQPSFPAVFTGDLNGRHVGLHGTVESVEALEAYITSQPAEQPTDSDRHDALCDSQYAAGMKLGWNLCVAGKEVEFNEIVEARSRAACSVLKTPAEQPRGEAKWQDMSLAPHDGQGILVWNGGDGVHQIASWIPAMSKWLVEDFYIDDGEPDGWQPLPEWVDATDRHQPKPEQSAHDEALSRVLAYGAELKDRDARAEASRWQAEYDALMARKPEQDHSRDATKMIGQAVGDGVAYTDEDVSRCEVAMCAAADPDKITDDLEFNKACVRAVLDEFTRTPRPAVATPDAWMAEDGRVIDRHTYDAGQRAGGATLSAIAPFSIPLVRAVATPTVLEDSACANRIPCPGCGGDKGHLGESMGYVPCRDCDGDGFIESDEEDVATTAELRDVWRPIMERALRALERGANDTLDGRNVAEEIRTALTAQSQVRKGGQGVDQDDVSKCWAALLEIAASEGYTQIGMIGESEFECLQRAVRGIKR